MSQIGCTLQPQAQTPGYRKVWAAFRAEEYGTPTAKKIQRTVAGLERSISTNPAFYISSATQSTVALLT